MNEEKLKEREALCMSDRLSLIGKMRDEGIFSLSMLTPYAAKKKMPKAPQYRPKPKEKTGPSTTVAEEITKLKQEEERRKQYAILAQRREKLEQEKQAKMKRDAEELAAKAKKPIMMPQERALRRLATMTGMPPFVMKKEKDTKLTKEEEQKLEKLVALVESKNRLAASGKHPSLLFRKLKKRFNKTTSKSLMVNRFVSGMAPQKELTCINGILSLTSSGCIICGKSNVKVM